MSLSAEINAHESNGNLKQNFNTELVRRTGGPLTY